jgi:hypothetical protein
MELTKASISRLFDRQPPSFLDSGISTGIFSSRPSPAMKVYLDDERATPQGWHRVYWPDEAIELLCSGVVSEISLDHDLGDDVRGTGYDVVLWIEEAVATRGFRPPIIRVHSANSSAREKMERGIDAIMQIYANLNATG